jgi:hypothetical protein
MTNEEKTLNKVGGDQDIINGLGSTESPTEVTGRMEPLPTMMEWGWKAEGGRGKEMLPECRVVWLEAPESATQLVASVGGVNSMVLKEPARDCGSHSPDHDVQDCC